MIGTSHGRIAPPQAGLFMAAWGRRRVLALAMLALALCLFAPVPSAASAADAGRALYGVGDGRDALGLRLGLLCFVGLVVAGGVYAQHQALVALRRGRRVSLPSVAPQPTP